jgi:hypothetical protein
LFLQAQQQQLERAEGACQRSAGRLREMQQHLAAQGGGGAGDAADGARVLEVLQDDVARLRVQVGVVVLSVVGPRLWVADALQMNPQEVLTSDSTSAAVQIWGCWTLSQYSAK